MTEPKHLGSANHDELIRIETLLAALLRYLNTPGDWAYGSLLGDLTIAVHGALGAVRRGLNDTGGS